VKNTPYEKFGEQLRKIRLDAKESIAEVSGAVEVDVKDLSRIESGNIQPTEDILLLLISHFALKEDEALRIWELAGYSQDKTGVTSLLANDNGIAQTAYVSPVDVKIVYTDMVHVNANRYGVVLNFLQSIGANNQPMAIARVGMSHEHAKSLLEVLHQTLKLADKQPPQDTETK
jgi:transcriptional regulator with XRE-family HTH domain